jgi:benzodiazapine receptor
MVKDAQRSTAGRRPFTHDVLTGLAVTAGAVAAAAVLARLATRREDLPEIYSDYEDPNAPPAPAPPRQTLFAMLWPPLFLGLTVSGLRIWGGPRGPGRTHALAMWGLAQALNTVWMAFGPRRLGGQVATTVASLGTAGAYALRARRVAPAAHARALH